jgi:hypothetical protein
MEKNIEELAKIGEITLKLKLEDTLRHIKKHLQIGDSLLLKDCLFVYRDKVKIFKEKYDVEFPDIEGEYQKMLPEIDKYLEL